jgi:hypothetical protein
MGRISGTSTRMKGAKNRARPINKSAPTEPGRYFWSEWRAVVEVFARRKKLFVTPPGGVTIPVTPHLAGHFTRIPDVHG